MKITKRQLRSIIREAIERSEEDGESFELDIRHYRLKDQYGRATVGHPKRYEDLLRKRGSLYKLFAISESSMGLYLKFEVLDGNIKTKKQLEQAIDELAKYYQKIRIRRDPKQTYLQSIGEEPPDTTPTHRPIDKEKIMVAYEKAMKDHKEHEEWSRRHRVTPGLTPGDKPLY